MKSVIRKLIISSLDKAKNCGELELLTIPEIVVEKPKDDKFGDFSTSLPMMIAKSEKMKPHEVAKILSNHLKSEENQIASIDIAGPGFINLKMDPNFFLSRLSRVAEQGNQYGSSNSGKGKKVLLEFVSANPTGPLHVGHGRGAAVGDMLGRLLLLAGYDVSTEYYINDVGNQMNTLGRSTLSRYREILGVKNEFLSDYYQGDYVKEIAKEIHDKHGSEFLDSEDEQALPFFRNYALNSILEGIKTDLVSFGVKFDRWFSEKQLYDEKLVDSAVN